MSEYFPKPKMGGVSFSKLKWDVDELDIGKLKAVPVNLSKLCNVVNNDAGNTDKSGLEI